MKYYPSDVMQRLSFIFNEAVEKNDNESSETYLYDMFHGNANALVVISHTMIWNRPISNFQRDGCTLLESILKLASHYVDDRKNSLLLPTTKPSDGTSHRGGNAKGGGFVFQPTMRLILNKFIDTTQPKVLINTVEDWQYNDPTLHSALSTLAYLKQISIKHGYLKQYMDMIFFNKRDILYLFIPILKRCFKQFQAAPMFTVLNHDVITWILETLVYPLDDHCGTSLESYHPYLSWLRDRGHGWIRFSSTIARLVRRIQQHYVKIALQSEDHEDYNRCSMIGGLVTTLLLNFDVQPPICYAPPSMQNDSTESPPSNTPSP